MKFDVVRQGRIKLQAAVAILKLPATGEGQIDWNSSTSFVSSLLQNADEGECIKINEVVKDYDNTWFTFSFP